MPFLPGSACAALARVTTIDGMNPGDVHRITRGQIEHILWCLRLIDRARKDLVLKGSATNDIVDELQKCSDGIYHVVKDLPKE